jgi:low affinity Fe/Cu permease
MNRLLFQMADFISRPPGFYFLMIAMVACTAALPLSMTDVVTYGLSVLAIVITGVVLIQGLSRHRGHSCKAGRDRCRASGNRNDVVGLEHSDPKEIKAVLERLEGEAGELTGATETSNVTTPRR